MRALKIKKNLWLKPRICYECGKFDLFARHYLSERCRICSKSHRHGVKRKHDHHKYGKTYRRCRAELIAKHPYCSLCGSSENLTVHHVGGGADLQKLTVLCDECHQAYERWNLKGRKDTKWRILSHLEFGRKSNSKEPKILSDVY